MRQRRYRGELMRRGSEIAKMTKWDLMDIVNEMDKMDGDD